MPSEQLGSIDHIVQLMLENRSFDQMLGFLYANNVSPLTGQPFDGLTGTESNPDGTGRTVPVYKIAASTDTYLSPGADPGEGYGNTNLQLFSSDVPAAGEVPQNQGFVVNFKQAIASDLARHFSDTLPGTQASQIMGMYAPASLPILSNLAKGYAVCDRWFASVPSETFPNRAFASGATSLGFVSDSAMPKVYTCPSIFGRLSTKNIPWAIYGYNRDPLTRLDFTDTRSADESHFGHFRDFQEAAAKGTLPAYTFLEPSWGSAGNSQHPNYDVALGEQLIHDVYYALRNGPAWNATLLIITYDEHGGNYDHVAPPWGATPPDASIGEQGFDFTRFGVRVPAVLVSPLIAQGTVFRTSTGVIDHTSVLKTIELRWNVPPLTKRDAAAPDISGVLTLTTPRTDDPLAGMLPPAASGSHPNAAQPSHIDIVQAAKVASLPLRNETGIYANDYTPPVLQTADDVATYIQTRMAAWKQHLQHLRHRRELHDEKLAEATPPPSTPAQSAPRRTTRKKTAGKKTRRHS
jgi:phospholipase C